MEEDRRKEEFECLEAIYPEMVFDPSNPFRASIELSVNPLNPVIVAFQAASDGTMKLPTPPLSTSSEENDVTNNRPDGAEFRELTYLPSLQLHITLPEGYPETEPPKFELSTTPAWLPRSRIDELEDDGIRMWEKIGYDSVVYTYIDSLQQRAENAFGYGEQGKMLEIAPEDKISLLDFDINAIQVAFDKGTYGCGICLEPKKGSACHKMVDCGHVFCTECLQDFYNNAIKEGDLVSVRCLDPNCAKERAEKTTKKSRKTKTQLSPSELLQIPLEHDVVTRFVKLKHKAQLESDKNTVYCPRAWCGGAARSKKYRKPKGLEDDDNSGDESDVGDTNGTDTKGNYKEFISGADLLSICEDCTYAFCSRCLQGWHGEFKVCTPKREKGELSEEERASLEYIELHTTPCPTCAAPVQKTHGCNHMICYRCQSHFCYLCSAWLDAGNPYRHFNEVTTGCFQRLWELEAGDGDDVGHNFAGGLHLDDNLDDEQPEFLAAVREPDDEEELLVGVGENGAQVPEVEELEPEFPAPAEREIEQEPLLEVERQAPLVLRLNQPHPAPQAAQAVPAVPDAPRRGPANRQNRQNQQNRGRANRPPHGRPDDPNRQDPIRPGAGRGRVRGMANADMDDQMVGANHEWVQRFVQMALNDEEDLVEWDDEEENHAAWEIPVR